ncbi:MFS transporter [Frankia tisae]|uniref:MFS transporter n=1 Tax=Frankia tisae TaxID=2950104 RepID=UPI0021BEFFF3|nr:MFS transporter [Frankia tisae]
MSLPISARARAVASPAPSSPASSPASSNATVLTLACVAQFMVILDVSIVNVALPAMQHGLGLSAAGQQWIVTAYTLGFAGLLLLGGRVADLVGVRRVFQAGLAGFTLASLAGGLATSGAMLIAARVGQGVGAAFLAPATLTLITTTFTEPTARTRAVGAWSTVTTAGGAAGAVLGGVLTQYLGWRWVLFVNVPVGVAVLAVAGGCIPTTGERVAGGSSADAPRRLDLPGAAAISAALTTLVYGVVNTETHGLTDLHVAVPLAAAALLLAGFVAVEATTAQPLVPLAMLRRRPLAGANLIMIFVGGALFPMWFLLSLYLQQVLHYNAAGTGLCLLPGALSIIVGGRIAVRLLATLGPRRLLAAGMTLSTAGFAWLSRVGATGDYRADVLAPFLLTALGMGLAITPTTVTATQGIDRSHSGLASGLVNTSRQVGGALGLAILATVAAHTVAARLHTRPMTTDLADGYARALLGAAVITATAALASLLLPGRRPQRSVDLPRSTGRLSDVADPEDDVADSEDTETLTEEACRVLRAMPVPAASLVGPQALSVPGEPGLYAWWATPGVLPGVPAAAHPSMSLGLLYVGIAGTSLRQRIVRQHLAANTGSSTFRFTLASHLLAEGGLTPFRKGGKVLLPPAQLAWLRHWQVSYLHVSWVARPDPTEVEAAVIAAMEPPLNGDDNANHPYRQRLRELRAAFRLRADGGSTDGGSTDGGSAWAGGQVVEPSREGDCGS